MKLRKKEMPSSSRILRASNPRPAHDAAIVDPCDPQLMMSVVAAETLLGRDANCKSYLRAYREGRLGPVT